MERKSSEFERKGVGGEVAKQVFDSARKALAGKTLVGKTAIKGGFEAWRWI